MSESSDNNDNNARVERGPQRVWDVLEAQHAL
jgi:hypothetical protein